MASLNCSGRSPSATIPGSTPTVETVMCRAPMPSPAGEFSTVKVGSTAFQFMSGSPIPMKTMFVTGFGGVSKRISRT